MKELLRSSKTLVVMILLLSVTVSFANVMDIGDVPLEFGFETDSTVIDNIPVEGEDFNWIGAALWQDMAPDTIFTDEGDTLIKGEDFDGNYLNTMTIVNDEAHGGTRSLYMTNNIEGIQFHGGMEMDIRPENMDLGAEYKVSFWTKYEISEGYAWWGLSLYDGYEEGDWTGLSDGWEYHEYTLNWMDASFYIGFGMKGAGKCWIDDVKIEQIGEPITNLQNSDFEEAALDNDYAPKHWYTTLGMIGYATDPEDSTNYAYVDGEGVNGSKCIKFQQFDDDTTDADDWYAWCTDFPFLLGYIYEISMDVKIEHMLSQNLQFIEGWYHVEAPLIANGDDRLDDAGNTDGWITLKDTIVYPTGYQNLVNIFRIEVHGSGHTDPDSLLSIWVDNVNCEPLGKTPSMINNEYTVSKTEEGEFTVNFTPEDGVTYTVLQEPLEWTEEENIVDNPGYELANDDGNLANWIMFDESGAKPDAFDVAYMAWLTPDMGMGIDGSGCAYIGPEDPNNQPKGVCASWRQYYPSSSMLPDPQKLYLYRVMAKYADVELANDRNWKVTPDDFAGIFDNDPTPEDSINIAGVYIYPRYYHDAFHVQGPTGMFALGYDKKYGTSDGWEEQAYPFTPNDVFWKDWGHYFQVGMGHQYPMNLALRGEVFFDNAGIIPFDEVMTGVGGSSFTITPPEGVRWLGIRGRNDAGIDGAASVIYIDTTQVPEEVAIDDDAFARKFKLEQNYPNPFNPTTQISYYLPKAEQVTLFVYDILGREITRLVDKKQMTAGAHNVNFDASNIASGVYFYKIKAGKNVKIKKMMLLK